MDDDANEGRASPRLAGAGTLLFLGLALAGGMLAYVLRGPDAVWRAVDASAWLIIAVLPQLVAGLIIGGLARQLVPQEQVARFLGARSGVGGLLIAGLVGMLTPGGPFTSFPLVYALYVAGADVGALVAYVSAWSLVGLNRLLVWELPFLGVDLTILRFVASLPLPILAGMTARALARTAFFRLDRPGGEEN